MSLDSQLLDFPSEKSEKLIHEIIKNLNIEHTNIIVTKGSQTGDNYLSEIFRVTIKNNKDDALNLILKLTLPSMEIRNQMDIHNMYEREVFVYSELLPILHKLQEDHGICESERFRFTKLFKGCTEESNEILIMEDLAAKGFKMYDRRKAFDFEHASLCIKTLARFHASTIVLKDKNPAYYQTIQDRFIKMVEFGNAYESLIATSKPIILKECQGEPYHDKMLKFYESMYEELQMYIDSDSAAPYNVICHGDCWNNNFLFKYDGERVVDMRQVDWQLLKEASPVTDISYMLMLSSDRNLRSNHYNDLLDMYYKHLSSNVTKMGVDINKYYPEHIYRQQLKKYMRYGLIIATIALPIVLCDDGVKFDFAEIIDKEADFVTNNSSKERLKELIEDCIEYGYL